MPTLLELLGSHGWLAFGFLGGLVSEPGAARHFYAAFSVHSEALGGDDVAFFDDVFDVFSAPFGEFGDARAYLLPTIFKDLLEEFINGVPGVGVFELDFVAGNLSENDA